mgnify:FL=1
MEACVVSRSHEYVSVENRTWDKRKAYSDKSMDIDKCLRAPGTQPIYEKRAQK